MVRVRVLIMVKGGGIIIMVRLEGIIMVSGGGNNDGGWSGEQLR